jgi:hypothetical protein
MELVDQAVAYVREGFGAVNQLTGLLIALVLTIFMGSWKQWIPFAVLATVLHILINQFAPVISSDAELRLPDVTSEGFWAQALVLLLGYLIVIAIFFFVKRLFFKGGAAKH